MSRLAGDVRKPLQARFDARVLAQIEVSYTPHVATRTYQSWQSRTRRGSRTDLVVVKSTGGAFSKTNLDAELRSRASTR